MDMHRPIGQLTTAKKLQRLRHIHSSITGPPKQRHKTPARLILPIHHIRMANAPMHCVPHLVVRIRSPYNTMDHKPNSPSRSRQTEQSANRRRDNQNIKTTRKEEEKEGATSSTGRSQGPAQAHIKHIYQSRAAPGRCSTGRDRQFPYQTRRPNHRQQHSDRSQQESEYGQMIQKVQI